MDNPRYPELIIILTSAKILFNISRLIDF